MSFTEPAVSEIVLNRERKSSGKFNSIPFGYKRLEQHVPGVQLANYTIVTANSGIGKSKFTKNLFVFRPYEFVLSHPESDIRFTTLYICLEETGKSFMQSYIAYRNYTINRERLSVKELRSELRPEDRTAVIPENTLKSIESDVPFYREFEKSVILIDDVHKPYQIYKRVQEYLHEVGDFSMKKGEVSVPDPLQPSGYRKEKRLVRDRYITDHPRHYIQVVVDHVSLLEPEKGQESLHEAIRIFSSRYAVNLRNRYGCAVVLVQQQASDTERQQYTYRGTSIESKLEPSLAGLGDCKLTQRDADEVFGLFAPDRYEIAEHRGYDITRLQDNYRSFSILKSRDGRSNLRLGFYFDGAVNYLAELPRASDMTPAHYERVLKLSGRS